MKRKTYILVLPLIMIFICGITLAEPPMQKAEIKQITPQKIQKGKALKVLDENELKNKKIDIRTLPDNQRIRIEGKAVTVRELKARAAQQEQKMKASANRLAKQAESKFQSYKRRFEHEQARRQNQLWARTKAELKRLKKLETKKIFKPKPEEEKPVIKPKPKEEEPEGVENPVISKLSVNHGQPGDPVIISGQDFGNRTGWVEVYVAPGDARRAKVDYWSPTQILASVPDVSGIQRSYNGGLYINTATGSQSNLVSFRFDPVMEVKVLMPWYEKRIRYCWPNGANAGKHWTRTAITVWHAHDAQPWGCSTDDDFYRTTRLINGWVVDNVEFTKTLSESGEADATVSESHVGTNNPYVKVHWWVTAWDWLTYTLAVYIKGPKGVAYIETLEGGTERGTGPRIVPKGD